jgi:hypothetical protein
MDPLPTSAAETLTDKGEGHAHNHERAGVD